MEASDPLFTEPYVDTDKWRDEPVRHRYVHGGFKGTDARFSLYFPPTLFIGVAIVVAGGVIYSGLLRLADALKNQNLQ